MFNFMLEESIGALPIVGVFAAVLLIVLFFSFVPVRLWISALASNVRIGIMTLINMCCIMKRFKEVSSLTDSYFKGP